MLGEREASKRLVVAKKLFRGSSEETSKEKKEMKQEEFKILKPLDYKSGQEMALKNRICKEAEWTALAGYGRISRELREKR